MIQQEIVQRHIGSDKPIDELTIDEEYCYPETKGEEFYREHFIDGNRITLRRRIIEVQAGKERTRVGNVDLGPGGQFQAKEIFLQVQPDELPQPLLMGIRMTGPRIITNILPLKIGLVVKTHKDMATALEEGFEVIGGMDERRKKREQRWLTGKSPILPL